MLLLIADNINLIGTWSGYENNDATDGTRSDLLPAIKRVELVLFVLYKHPLIGYSGLKSAQQLPGDYYYIINTGI